MRLLVCVFVTFVHALVAMQGEWQDPRLQRFVGVWHGEGTLELMAGARSVPWRGTCEFDWVLGGAFLRERLWIEPSDAIPNGIEAEGYYGWRADRKRYDLLWFDSLGHLRRYAGQWSDEATFVAAQLTRFAGLPRVDRQIVRVDPQGGVPKAGFAQGGFPPGGFPPGGFKVEMQAAVGTAPLTPEIVARFTRAERAERTPRVPGKPGIELAAFARLAQAYSVEVDQPSERHGWRGSLRGAFAADGVVLRCELALGPANQGARADAIVFFGWDAENEQSTYTVVDRQGSITSGVATWTTPDVLVLLGHALDSDQRFERATVTFAADGSLRCGHDVVTATGTQQVVLRGTPAK